MSYKRAQIGAGVLFKMRHAIEPCHDDGTRSPTWRRHWWLAAFVMSILACAQLVGLPQVAAGPSRARSTTGEPAVVGADADQLGTNWYPNADISPTQVNSNDFGQLFDVTLPPVNGVSPGQIYAQPIVANGVLLIVTENDNAYGVDPNSGTVEWSRNFGRAWQASTINCGDLTPSVGITGTPVVDTVTGTAYFTTDATPSSGGALWQMQAVVIKTGHEVANFPVPIRGRATNAPDKTFNPVHQMQRPGLALVKNVVYAAFGSHCDLPPWYGWIAGVTPSGELKDMWVDETGSAEGAGIWGPGGIVVDSAGNLYVSTGNGGSPPVGPGLGVPQPSGLAECVLKLSTSGPNLKLTDHFCPSDADQLNTFDGDLGAGSPTGLPASFGTAKDPDLLVEVGKAGEVYLLDRNDLGGFDQGPGGGDKVVSETGPLGGVWSHPAVWPGDGGYVYITTASPPAGAEGGGGAELDVYQRVVSDGEVSLNWVADVPDMPFGSSPPIVTSDGTVPGSAVVWNIARTGLTNQANLVAYGAVPVAGTGADPAGQLPMLWEASVGNSTKFNSPLAYDGRIYMGNYDGQILAFGPRDSAPPLTGTAVEAQDTVLGSSSQTTASFTASGDVTVTGVSISTSTSGASGAFTTPSLAAPMQLSAGGQLPLPVTFEPELVGGQQGTLTLTTNLGSVSVPVSGRGIPEGAPIAPTPPSVNFGIRPIGGGAVNATVAFQNTSASSVTVSSVDVESGTRAPFSIGVLPKPLPVLAPQATLSVPVSFTPPRTSGDFVQNFNDHLVITTSAGKATVPLQGSAAPDPQIAISPLSIDVGTVAIGQSATVSFTVGNRGGTPLTINQSKPPISNGFSAVTTLKEATVIPAHVMDVETVRFSPRKTGTASATWLITGNDGSGPQTITFTGSGAEEHLIASPLRAGWSLSGDAKLAGPYLQLTSASPNGSGAAFFDTAVPPNGLRASFTATFKGGTGGDGLTFALVSASSIPAHPGADGAGLGLAGLPAVAVALQTFPNAQNPSGNAIGVVTSSAASRTLVWNKVDNSVPLLRSGATRVSVTVSQGVMTVVVGGFTVLTQLVSLPKQVYLGFTGATGSRTDRQLVSAVQLSYP
ncbi:MAG: choice-of-anchor D domain-containing protein [Acidimicrobiales bacterium]